MNTLCPMCFAEDSKTVSLCFDGNFQLTILRTKIEDREGIPAQELDDLRIFIEDVIPPKESISNAMEETNHRNQTRKDV